MADGMKLDDWTKIRLLVNAAGVWGKTPIMVWRFDSAPEELQALSGHGGDEDWLALVPPDVDYEWVPWLDDRDIFGNKFGVCEVTKHQLPEGYVVFIGAHA